MVMRWLAAGVVVLMLLALFIGGAQPQAVGLFSAPWDKVAHGLYFFVLAFLLARFFSFSALWVVVLALLVAVADETHQMFLPGRVASWDDGLADAVGVGLGLVALKVLGIMSQRFCERRC